MDSFRFFGWVRFSFFAASRLVKKVILAFHAASRS